MTCCRRYSGWWLFVSTLLLCVQATVTCVAQRGTDSVYHRFDPAWTRYYFIDHPDRLEVVDTSTALFHRHQPAFDRVDVAFLGNLGQAAFRLTPAVETQSGYRVGIGAYDAYFFSLQNLPMFSTRRPYTELDYVLGFRNEQRFSGRHTQNITGNYNFNIHFDRTGSEGAFQNQRADYVNLGAGQSFVTRDRRYFLRALIYQNRAKVEQNGGIALPLDLAYSSDFFDKRLVPVRLDSGLTTLRQRNAVVRHGYQFGRSYDTRNDSLAQRTFYTTARVEHRFHYRHSRFLFHTDAIDFDRFDFVYADPRKTNDSIIYHRTSNEFRFELSPLRSRTDTTTAVKPVSGFAGLEHELYRFVGYELPSDQEIIGNVIGKLDVRTNLFDALQPGNPIRRFGFNMAGQYTVHGFNEGDYAMQANALVRIGPLVPELFAQQSRNRPTRVQSFYHGNHHRWDNEFTASVFTHAGAGLYYRLINGFVRLGVVTIERPVFFTADGRPAQLNGLVKGLMLQATPNLTVGDFNIYTNLIWQQYDNDLMTYPSFQALATVAYNASLFKRALGFTVGLEARYHSLFNGPAFDPATSQFLVQHDKASGGYPWVDLFMNIKIRSVRVSLLGQNLLQGITQPAAIYAVPYPMPDRGLKLRINWLFWN